MFCPPIYVGQSADALQLKKKHANTQNTRKLRIHLHQIDNTCGAFRKRTENTNKTTKYINEQQLKFGKMYKYKKCKVSLCSSEQRQKRRPVMSSHADLCQRVTYRSLE